MTPFNGNCPESMVDFKLYDLYELEKLFKACRRTLFNWRALGLINLVKIRGKLYMTQTMVDEALAKGLQKF